ncbi:MAG TPA: hypothetical protein VMD25_00220 [Acidobacteriaceae bacterium]|nr:hypothetical protein [Acidobacteriaceae bacterium]
MVTPIDAVRCGMGFDERGHWHQARPRFIPAPRQSTDQNPLAPAHGLVWGAVAGGVLWIGIIAAVRVLLHLL